MDWSNEADAAGRSRLRRAAVAAAVCFAINVAASILAALWLREWTESERVFAHSKYVLANLTKWRVAWGAWMLAGPALVAFFAAFASTLTEEMRLVRTVAVCAAVLGLFADLSAEVVFAYVLPGKYAALPDADALHNERQAMDVIGPVAQSEGLALRLTGGLANGLYVIAGAMLAAAAYSTPGFPRGLVWASVPAWLTGGALSVLVFLGRTKDWSLAMAVMMACFVLWLFAVAIVAWQRASTAVPASTSPSAIVDLSPPNPAPAAAPADKPANP